MGENKRETYLERLRREAPNKKVIWGYQMFEDQQEEINNPLSYDNFLIMQDILEKICDKAEPMKESDFK